MNAALVRLCSADFLLKDESSGVPHDPLLPPTASARSWNQVAAF